MPDKFEVFLADGAVQINIARMQHLASLNLELAGKRILEVGAGIGRLTSFFEALNCSILSTDGRTENVDEMRRRFPYRKIEILDLEMTSDLSYLGEFDVVFCYGTLYHLKNPKEALNALAQVCREMILLETCVTPGDQIAVNLVEEDCVNPNQAFSGTGCRPTRPWIMKTLNELFGLAYVSRYQPCHCDFDLNWENAVDKKLHRAIFVGSRTPFNSEKLSDVLLGKQIYEPICKRVWIDVGTHLGETTFKAAVDDPLLTVYGFEPNLNVASQLFRKLPNYIVIPVAIASKSGLSLFHLNQFEAASSLLPFNPERLEQWIDGDQLQIQATYPVPTLRLDQFLEFLEISQVEFLKVDAQGSDFDVILSLSDRIKDCIKIQLEVAITESQLYLGSAHRAEIIQYFFAHGFILIEAHSQSYGQEENLVFIQKDKVWMFPDIGDKICQLEESDILAIAETICTYQPLELYPGWEFNLDWNHPNPLLQLRRKIWEFFRDKTGDGRIKFNWYHDLKLYLYLSNDLSSQLFVAGTYEPNELYYLSQSLSPGMTFLDVGANEGIYTLLAASLLGTAGSVLAFEPSKREFERLQNNIELNASLEGLASIKAYPFALSDRNGEHSFKVAEQAHSGQNTLGDFMYETAYESLIAVEVRRLDDVVEELGIEQVDVVKMDIEGAEFLALQGAKNTLERFKPLLFLEIFDKALKHQGSCSQDIWNFLDALGYQMFYYSEFTALPLVAKQVLSLNGNVIAAHPERPWNFLMNANHLDTIQTELNLTQAKLGQTRTEVAVISQSREKLQYDYDRLLDQVRTLENTKALIETELHTELHSVQNQLAAVQSELIRVEREKSQTVALLEAYQNRVAAMERSKFWCLRNGWVALKRRLGLLNEDEK